MNNAGRLTCAMTLVSLAACSSPSITNVSGQEPTGGTTGETATGGATAAGGTSSSSTTSSIGGAGGSTISKSQATGGASAGATGGSNNGGTVATGGTLQAGTTSAPSAGRTATGGTAPNSSTTGGTATGGVSPTGGRATDGGAPTGGRTGLTLTGGTTSGPATGGRPPTGGATSGPATGGAATGGAAATGGMPATGGATSGLATGGAATGGAATGGAATGGAATGGRPPTGGSPSYTLTVSFEGSGTVTIQPGNTTCTSPTMCTATFAGGTAVTLTATPTNTGTVVTSMLGGWSGACNGINRVCSLTMNTSTAAMAKFVRPPANLVFASSLTFLGNLGGAAAYQTQCNKLATNAGINNATGDAYIAWIAASNYDPRTLLSGSRGWVRLDSLPWIDDMTTALSAGAVYYPVAFDETGQRIMGYTFSGMDGNAALYTGDNCNDWSSTTPYAAIGHTHAGGKGWPRAIVGFSSCGGSMRVLCVMKGAATPVSVTPVAGKKIYLTKSAWVPGGGVADADATCMANAPASVTSARAILVASTRALTDVLIASNVYVRPDGVRVGTGAEIVSALTGGIPLSIESTVTQNGSGVFVDPSIAQDVWTGIKDTCRDWTSSASTENGTVGAVANWLSAGNNGTFPCNNSSSNYYLQCAEQ
jgi:hypothetical protein